MSKEHERRISERVPAKFVVNYIHKGDYLISHSKDLSVNGMFLHTENPPKGGEQTSLEFQLPEGDKFILEAEVIWSNNQNKSQDAGMAVKFINTSGDEKNAILDYIKRIAVIETS